MPAEPTCQAIVELAVAQLRVTASPTLSPPVAAHLAACPDCRTYLEQIQRTVRLLGSLPVEPVSAETKLDLIERFRRWKAISPAPAPAAGAGASPTAAGGAE